MGIEQKSSQYVIAIYCEPYSENGKQLSKSVLLKDGTIKPAERPLDPTAEEYVISAGYIFGIHDRFAILCTKQVKSDTPPANAKYCELPISMMDGYYRIESRTIEIQHTEPGDKRVRVEGMRHYLIRKLKQFFPQTGTVARATHGQRGARCPSSERTFIRDIVGNGYCRGTALYSVVWHALLVEIACRFTYLIQEPMVKSREMLRYTEDSSTYYGPVSGIITVDKLAEYALPGTTIITKS
jgi:hypothetical protein